MAKKITIGFIVFFISLCIFCFIRLLYIQSWFSKVTISNDLIPLDVVSLLVSSLLTVFLAWYITKKLTEQRFEKEFIIEDLKNIETQINYIERITSDIDSIQLQPILDLLSKLQTHIDRFNKTIKVLQIPCRESNKLNASFATLYRKATDVDGLQLDIDSVKRNEIHTVCTNFIIITRSLVCSINKQ
jgi:hypothetical protein